MKTKAERWQDLRLSLTTPFFSQSLEKLIRESDLRLSVDPYSVLQKKKPSPAGDFHDYVSQGPYWWPDPSRPDGLPYIRKDGQVNPESQQSDSQRMEKMCDAVCWLALRAHLTGSQPHAEKAGQLLRTWFLDPATRMNPHLRFAQAVPGVCEGRGFGLIDTNRLCQAIDLFELVPDNASWNAQDRQALQAWFSQFTDWFLQSESGQKECQQNNNHGTWFDAQVCRYALFSGNHALAKKHLETYSFARIRSQFDADGSQPHELARTLSFMYCNFNLLAFSILAQCATQVGYDLWNWKDERGCSLMSALNWMLPYYTGEKKWTWDQIKDFDRSSSGYIILQAAQTSTDPRLKESALSMISDPWNTLVHWRHFPEKNSQLTPAEKKALLEHLIN
jgi:hypothetical protein